MTLSMSFGKQITSKVNRRDAKISCPRTMNSHNHLHALAQAFRKCGVPMEQASTLDDSHTVRSHEGVWPEATTDSNISISITRTRRSRAHLQSRYPSSKAGFAKHLRGPLTKACSVFVTLNGTWMSYFHNFLVIRQTACSISLQ